MQIVTVLLCVTAFAAPTRVSAAEFSVTYLMDAGGSGMNALIARATFSIDDAELTVLLENISTDLPEGFDTADSLLVSLGLNLPGVDILSGDAAVIGPGSQGLGRWSTREAGDSVAEEWLWTNDRGGDLMEDFAHVISTSNGQGGGTTTRFDGMPGGVSGPFGGIAAMPPFMPVPQSKPAVSNSILFELTLTGSLTDAQLRQAAVESIVEFGSDRQYLRVPEPVAVSLLLLPGLILARRRRARCRFSSR